jgi:hypothetical protein
LSYGDILRWVGLEPTLCGIVYLPLLGLPSRLIIQDF